MSKRDDEKRMMRVGIINLVEDENCYEEEGSEVGGGDSPLITSIKTRVSNNNPYSTIIATLVPF